jgi:hypothetical protein
VLKLPLGALCAVGALVAIRGGFIPGFSDLDSQPQILAYAFGFGVAQQLLAGLIDRQAQTLLSQAPGKATASDRPERWRTTRRSPVLETTGCPAGKRSGRSHWSALLGERLEPLEPSSELQTVSTVGSCWPVTLSMTFWNDAPSAARASPQSRRPAPAAC